MVHREHCRGQDACVPGQASRGQPIHSDPRTIPDADVGIRSYPSRMPARTLCRTRLTPNCILIRAKFC
jgi:hypothetical protein